MAPPAVTDGDDGAVVADDGVDAEPALDGLQGGVAAHMLSKAATARLVEEHPFGSAAALGGPEAVEIVQHYRRDRPLLETLARVDG